MEKIRTVPHVSVCICTFKRPVLLERLLRELGKQQVDGQFTLSVVVADNDSGESAKGVVEAFRAASSIPTTYCVEPRQNIALARNKAVEHAYGDYIAFIDDDEFPTTTWITSLLQACKRYEAAGALGPVKPHFTVAPPQWMLKGRIAERPTHATGHVMHWRQSRTGNVLLRRELLAHEENLFRAEFGTGGEDVEFFQRMMKQGAVFVWCNEAEVLEEVPPERCTRSYHIRRALLRGRNSLLREGYGDLTLGKSLIAAPIYALMLPFLLLIGHHHFMRYAIKFSDHAGKLLAVVGMNPVKTR